MATSLKRTEQPSRTNAYIDMIEDAANTTADNVTLTKETEREYRVTVDGEVIGWVSGRVASNYKPFGSTLQVRLADSVKWAIRIVGESGVVNTSARSRIEAVHTLVRNFYKEG
tara:strand:+ start:320 stop:658 length:339 start_codon:yes stop_codon:yes gene_type:complete